jgi:hypothetical protein
MPPSLNAFTLATTKKNSYNYRRMRIEFKNAEESFGMSGPWLADCFLDNRRLKQKFLVDNFALSTDKDRIALSRYSESPARDRKFEIIVIDFNTKNYLISKKHYNALYVESFFQDTLFFYAAFHNELSDFKQATKVSVENFLILKSEDLFDS